MVGGPRAPLIDNRAADAVGAIGSEGGHRGLARLSLSTRDEGALNAALACADAVDHFHLDVARTRCGDAVAKDDALALAHLWLAQSLASPEAAGAELAKAEVRAANSSRAERLFVDGWRARKEGRAAQARRAYDELVQILDGEPRAFAARGQLRLEGGDVDGAVADFERAAALDEKYAAAQNLLGFALAERGQQELAVAALRKYVQMMPQEPNAHDSLALVLLRGGDAVGAAAEARKALAVDGKFVVAHGTLGDALLAEGKLKDARKEYGVLAAADDATLRHDGAMRAARSYFLEEKWTDGERALIKEGDVARRARRSLEATDAFLEAARSQLERGALAEAGRGISEAIVSLQPVEGEVAAPGTPLDEHERRQLKARLVEARAQALALLRERQLAEVRADELEAQLAALGDGRADERVRGLRGWMAWKNGDAKAAKAGLDKAQAPTLRLAYAQVLVEEGDKAKARAIVEELAKRSGNDLETALSRPRAQAMLRALGKAPKDEEAREAKDAKETTKAGKDGDDGEGKDAKDAK